MLIAIRIGILVVCPVIFYAAVLAFPSLAEAESLKILAPLGGVVWALNLYFLRKLGDLATLEGLTNRERERLVLKLSEIRRRGWKASIAAFFCAITIWWIVASGMVKEAQWYLGAIGFLVGVILSFVVIFPFWLDEIQSFIDRVNLEKARRASEEAEIQRLSGGKKDS